MKEHDEQGYDHVLKYTGLFGGVQGLVTLIGLVRNKFMALLLGTGGVGFSALLTSVQNFASQCTNLGISFGEPAIPIDRWGKSVIPCQARNLPVLHFLAGNCYSYGKNLLYLQMVFWQTTDTYNYMP